MCLLGASAFLCIIVIQTTEGRKNLENIKWVPPRFFASFHSALNDITYVNSMLPQTLSIRPDRDVTKRSPPANASSAC